MELHPLCRGDWWRTYLSIPAHSGSYYYNYKGTFSIVLLAVVDANYRFRVVYIGCNGRISDGGVLKNSAFGTALENCQLDLPEPKALPGRTQEVPYSIVGDDAFPLGQNMMKPYARRNLSVPARVFNYRLSRARRISENAFGILANRYRVLLSRMLLSPEKANIITLAVCSLHNYLSSKKQNCTARPEVTTRTIPRPTDYNGGSGAMSGNWTVCAIREEEIRQ